MSEDVRLGGHRLKLLVARAGATGELPKVGVAVISDDRIATVQR